MNTESVDKSFPDDEQKYIISQSLPRWEDIDDAEPKNINHLSDHRIIEGKVRKVKIRSAHFTATNLLDVFQLIVTILMLSIPTFALLLLSVWFPEGLQVNFDSMWGYLTFSLLLTLGAVVFDLMTQIFTRSAGFERSLAWFLEQFLTALALSLALWPFTGLYLGALLLALLIEIMTVVLSIILAKIFR